MSARSWSAVRARASATPGPSSSSSTGSTRDRTRGRANCGSLVVRVGPDLDPLRLARGDGVRSREVEQRPPVVLEGPPHPGQRPSTGATGQPEQHRLGLVVAGVPEQHRGRRSRRCATSSSTAYLAWRAAASGPSPPPSTLTRALSVSAAPSSAIWATTRSACSAEPSCSPWSTVAPTTCHAVLRASKTVAASSASESAPPEQATITVAPGGTSARPRRTARRTAATAGWRRHSGSRGLG